MSATLSLYRQMLRAAQRCASYNYRAYATCARYIRDPFRHNKSVADSVKLQSLLPSDIRRQASSKWYEGCAPDHFEQVILPAYMKIVLVCAVCLHVCAAIAS